MNITDQTPVREKVIQEKLYATAGVLNHSFNVPQPFTAAMFEHLRESLGIDPNGLAKQVNQVFSENLANNISSHIKRAVQNKKDLPTQADMDALAASYDFAGVHAASTAFASTFDKIFHRTAGQFIRKLLRKKGFQDMPAPVTVASKKAETLTEGQISFDDFEIEVIKLTEGDGPWGEKEAFMELREVLKQEALAEEERLRTAEKETEDKLAGIMLTDEPADIDTGVDDDDDEQTELNE